MKNRRRLMISRGMVLFALISIFISCRDDDPSIEPGDQIFQISTIDALLLGKYEGAMKFGDLQSMGNFGLGTFEAVDGEMVMLDDVFYQIKVSGEVSMVDPNIETPFAAVKHFETDESLPLETFSNLNDLQNHLDMFLDVQDGLYAIRIDATFDSLLIRSVPRQQEPYPPLDVVTAEQVTFQHYDIEGTLVGFRLPSYLANVNVAGYHFHFISQDRDVGGHVLKSGIREGIALIDRATDLNLRLPQ